MAIPQVIPIAREQGTRTAGVGRYADGQFLASVTYAYPVGYRPDDGWERHRRLYAVLHTFDADGHHRGTEAWCAGTFAEQQLHPDGATSVQARAEAHLAKLLDTLAGRAYGDIAVRPFRLTIDNVLFGLTAEEEDGDMWAELQPDRLSFGDPWDGRYE
jgi:formate hydrogenlyase regulatory protein HycA